MVKKHHTVRRKKRQSGRGVASDVLDFVKSHKLISKGLGMIPHPTAQGASQLAAMAGWGQKQHMHGGGIFSDLGSGIGSVFGGIGGGLGSVAHGLFGSGFPHPRQVLAL